MSSVLVRPAAPMQRLTTALTVLALVVLGAWLAALLGSDGPAATRQVAELGVSVSAQAPTALRDDPGVLGALRAPTRVVVLVSLASGIGLVGLLLALTQRGWADMALAGAGFLWPMYFSLGARGLFGHGTPASAWVMQALLLAAALLSAWYALRLLQSPSATNRPPAFLKALGVAVLAVWALRALGRIEEFTSGWIVPVACLLGGASALMRVVETARRGGSVLRPGYGAWSVALVGAVVVGCGAYELWVHSAQASVEVRANAWLATRWSVVVLLLVLLGLRFEQLARMLGQLGRSHRSWRKRLRESQRELHDARDRLTLHERNHHHRGQRDRVLRELHDELGHRLVRLQTLAQREAGADQPALSMQALVESALIELRMAYESLDPAPRPLADALRQLHDQLLPGLNAADVRLDWTIDARASMVVMSSADTLQVLRIVREALEPYQLHPVAPGSSGQVPSVGVHLEVLDGETGRHLRLRVRESGAIADAPPPVAGRTPHHRRAVAGAGGNRLQRQATMLGAQLSVEMVPDGTGAPRRQGLELVIPLASR